jgi:hypothetical protein
MLIVPISKLKALNWRIEVVAIEDVWTVDHFASGYRLIGLPDPIQSTEPVTLGYLQSGWGGLTGRYIPDEIAAVKEHHVDWGCADDQVNSSSVPYCHSVDYPTVEAVLDYLLYKALQVLSFTNSVGTVEIGSTVTSVDLNWAYNKDVTDQSIDQGIGTLDVALRTYSDSGSWTTDRTYTLSATDGTTPTSAQTSILFRQKRYWGPNASTSLDDSQVIALANSEFSETRVKSMFEIACSAQYIYYAYPASFGAATFTVNGLLNTAWTLVTRDFVNASGYTESYNIYRSDNLLTGFYQIVVT